MSRILVIVLFFCQTEDDSELNKAFVEGQDMSMEISVRDSISAISEIQEKLQTDSLESYSDGVSIIQVNLFFTAADNMLHAKAL